MTKEERKATIKFLEDYKKDLLIQVFKNLQKGNKDNQATITIINDIDKETRKTR